MKKGLFFLLLVALTSVLLFAAKEAKHTIDKEKCIGCSLCARNCPVECIFGSRTDKYEIVQKDCIKCGNCKEVCPVDAVHVLPGISEQLETEQVEEGLYD